MDKSNIVRKLRECVDKIAETISQDQPLFLNMGEIINDIVWVPPNIEIWTMRVAE